MKLRNLLLFILSIFILFIGILFLFPKDGIPIVNDKKIFLPSLSDVITPEKIEKQKLVAAIIDEEVAPDTIVIDPKIQQRLDSIREVIMQDSIRRWQLSLHYPNDDKSVLYPFFKAIRNSKNKSIRILHYGDSQMEGDRITGYLRNKLQSQFGGSGPGLLATIPICSSPLARYHYSDNWERFTGFGRRDKRIKHKSYGPNICFGKVMEIDSLSKDSTFSAELVLEKSHLATSKVKDWRNFKMMYNNAKTPFLFELYEDTTQVYIDYLFSEQINTFKWAIKNKNLKQLKIKISGKVCPDILGFSIEGKKGVWVDNIALRGSTGTIFRNVNRGSLAHFYNQNNIPLVIMQFGGNALPFLKDKKACDALGKKMKRNIDYIKSMIPNACIIMMGPSDMSVNTKGEWKTYPMLTNARDALKKATHDAGGVYFDFYEAMGGEDSMPIWVKAKPTLAAKDYIHFTRKGARKVASWFYDALNSDYKEWLLKDEKGK